MRRFGDGLPERGARAVKPVVELASDPGFGIPTLSARCGSQQSPKEGFGISLERGRGVTAELAGRRTSPPGDASSNPVYEHAAGAPGFAENFAFNNVIGHEV
jgi:hypothetical protein